jgi:hypothetical protein
MPAVAARRKDRHDHQQAHDDESPAALHKGSSPQRNGTKRRLRNKRQGDEPSEENRQDISAEKDGKSGGDTPGVPANGVGTTLPQNRTTFERRMPKQYRLRCDRGHASECSGELVLIWLRSMAKFWP